MNEIAQDLFLSEHQIYTWSTAHEVCRPTSQKSSILTLLRPIEEAWRAQKTSSPLTGSLQSLKNNEETCNHLKRAGKQIHMSQLGSH